jgi:hypothetical protein
MSMSFPFSAPGYLIEPVPAGLGTAFDVVRCPIADYFRGQGPSIFVPHPARPLLRGCDYRQRVYRNLTRPLRLVESHVDVNRALGSQI